MNETWTPQGWVLILGAAGTFATILGAVVVKIIAAWSNLRREVVAARVAAEAVKQETEAQTVVIKQAAASSSEAAKKAGEAADQANGKLGEATNKLETVHKEYIDTMKDLLQQKAKRSPEQRTRVTDRESDEATS